jgi:hypothetical protein
VKISTCSSCQAAILWAISESSGSRFPLDAEPLRSTRPGQPGLFVLVKSLDDSPIAISTSRVLYGARSLRAHRPALYQSHFASCPNASSHRRR